MDMIDEMQRAGLAWVDAVDVETEADVRRTTLRAELTDSLIGSDNPATGKPHSATSAEKAAEQTQVYLLAKEAARLATKVSRTAWVQYEVARLRAQASVRMAEGVAA